MKRIFLFILIGLIGANVAPAQKLWDQNKPPIPDPRSPAFTFIGYFFSRGTCTNIAAENDLLKGQTVGRLFGPNTTNTLTQSSTYFEQRLIPFFIFSPSLMDGFATLRASFEIDFTWGDAAYGTGGNFGAAFSADQVNVQTQNLCLEIKSSENFRAIVGLQRLFDNVRNPYTSFLTTLANTGYKLAYWGSDAVGINLLQRIGYTNLRLGYFQLYENNPQQNDDVAVTLFDLEREMSFKWSLGCNLWYMYDRASGEGGVSILGEGLNSQLADYNGVGRLTFPRVKHKADIIWAGMHTNYNPDFAQGRWLWDGFVMFNLGRVDTIGTVTRKAVDILGYAINGRISYKYAMTRNDFISFEGLYSSGDSDGISDGTYSGVITGNTYGSPGAIYLGHRSLLLFPDPKVINRYIAAVSDLSNIGYGVTAGFLNFSKDIIPNKWNAKLGLAMGISNVMPKQGGNLIGTEVNFEMVYTPKVYFQFGLHAAYLRLGDFYDSPRVLHSPEKRPNDPWTFFVTLTWLMF